MNSLNFLRKLLYGRNGPDPLSFALIILSFIISLLGQLFRFAPLLFLSYIILALVIFRIFSKNIEKRRRENDRFMLLFNSFSVWRRNRKAHTADKKTHRYYACPQCKQKLRVPRGRGKIKITCPKCGVQFVKKT